MTAWGSRGYDTGKGNGGEGWKVPIRKMAKRDIPAAVAAYDRILAESTAIRRRHGLEPVKDGPTIEGWRCQLEAGSDKSTARPTLTQWRELAVAALELLEVPAPATRGEMREALEAVS